MLNARTKTTIVTVNHCILKNILPMTFLHFIFLIYIYIRKHEVPILIDIYNKCYVKCAYEEIKVNSKILNFLIVIHKRLDWYNIGATLNYCCRFRCYFIIETYNQLETFIFVMFNKIFTKLHIVLLSLSVILFYVTIRSHSRVD